MRPVNDESPSDRDEVPFAPPATPVEVHCLHCERTFDSSLIELRDGAGPDGEPAWCCPTPGCDAAGFCFDLWPTDPEWRDADGELVCQWDEEADFEGHVDAAVLGGFWRHAPRDLLPPVDAPDELEIHVDGDETPPLVRMFGEAAPSFVDDEIPF